MFLLFNVSIQFVTNLTSIQMLYPSHLAHLTPENLNKVPNVPLMISGGEYLNAFSNITWRHQLSHISHC